MKNNNQKTAGGSANGKLAAGILLGILVVFAVIYTGFAIYFQSHFCFRTMINGIEVGGKEVEAVEELIRREISDYTLTLLVREGTSEEITGTSIAIEPVFDGSLEALLDGQNGFLWFVRLIDRDSFTLENAVTYDEVALEEILAGLSCMQEENQRAPADAAISDYTEGTGYELVSADYGTTVDQTALQAAVEEAILLMDEELDLDSAECYVNPQATDDDQALLSALETLNSYVGITITYDLLEKSETLDGETIHTWLSVAGGEVVIDEDAVLEYVKSLGKKYNTAYQSKTLETSYGTTVTITGGAYGWRIDNEAELAQILEDMENGESVSREPMYSQTANSHGENDYGDSYVEINLTAQHLFLYKDGVLITESDFVSGNLANGNGTPTGAYPLTYKTLNATLRGEGYATPVNYWMPFAGNVGMHDATWRSSFGGNIYKTNGSHGCINLPLEAAKTIYETIDQGYAVLVYTLPGTESISAQMSDAATVVGYIDAIGEVTLESETAISQARALYDALSDSAKSYVTNYDTLVAAEAALAQLKGESQPAEEQPVEEQVIQEQPVEEQTIQEQPVEEQSIQEQPVEEQTIQEQSAEESTDGQAA